MDIIPANTDRALQVLKEIDEILAWKKDVEQVVESKMMALANRLFEAYRNAYWIVRGYQDESEYIEVTFPKSRTLYYDLIRTARDLNHYDHRLLEQIGPSKCRELCKVQKAFGTVPNNYFIHAQEEDRDTFASRVKSAITGVRATLPAEKEEVSFVTLSFAGSQIYDFNEAVKIAMMESGTEKVTEAVCVMAKDFLSGYRDDGKGRIHDRNSFILGIVGRLYEQIDRNQKGVYDRMIAQLATWVEKGREVESSTKFQNQESQAFPGRV